mmetsp:Transcript_25796/g.38678  ORF Transcript_25796/g.38678 Transcript_25796/m.38678 type:complete len:124 (-) Transcript_25796:13-384(-)
MSASSCDGVMLTFGVVLYFQAFPAFQSTCSCYFQHTNITCCTLMRTPPLGASAISAMLLTRLQCPKGLLLQQLPPRLLVKAVQKLSPQAIHMMSMMCPDCHPGASVNHGDQPSHHSGHLVTGG